MNKKLVVSLPVIFALVFALGVVSSAAISQDLHLNIQTTNGSGSVVTGTFDFVFNISTTSDCGSVVYDNSASLTTDSRGIISYYLPDVSLNYSEEYYLCYYRDGTLINASKIVRTPYTFRARNITLSGVEIDSNMNLTNYNITDVDYGFFKYLGSLLNRITKLFVVDMDASGNVNITGNLTVDANTLFVDADNNRVGIGTSSPGSSLHVAGSIGITPTGDGVHLGLYGGTYGHIQLQGPSGGYIDFSTSGTDWRGRILYDNSSDYMRFDTSGTEQVRIDKDGKVGIGTSSPTSKLHIYDSVTDNQMAIPFVSPAGYGFDSTGNLLLIIGGNDTTGQDAGIAFRNEQSNTKWMMGLDKTDDKLHIAINNFATGQKLTILPSGNVGIGTSSPNYTLDIYANVGYDSEYNGIRIIGNRNPRLRLESSSDDTYRVQLNVDYNNAHPFSLIGYNGVEILGQYSGSSNVVLAATTGKVGIGTTTPQQELNVIGDLNVTGLCVAENSLISMADGSKKKITEVKEGEHVLSLNEETGEIVSNKVKALLDMGEKPIYELTTESGRAINTTGNHPYLVKLYSEEKCTEYEGDVWNKEYNEFNGEYCERWVSVDELEEGDSIAVPKETYEEDNEVYLSRLGGYSALKTFFVPQALIQNELSRLGQGTIDKNEITYLNFVEELNYNLSFLTNSEVDNILISSCFLNAFSSDQIEQLSESANAKYGSSFVELSCGDILAALDKKSLYFGSGTILISSSNVWNVNSNSPSEILENCMILSLSDLNSLRIKYGDINLHPTLNNSSTTCFLVESFLKNENNMFASTIIVLGDSIFYKPCLLATLFFNSSANSFACSSVNSDLDIISSNIENLILLTNCLTTLARANSNSDFSSCGTLTSIKTFELAINEGRGNEYLNVSGWLKVIHLGENIIIVVNGEKNKGVKNVTPAVRNFFTDYDNYNNNNYINFSVDDDNVEDATLILTVRNWVYTLALHREPGSTPGRGVSTTNFKTEWLKVIHLKPSMEIAVLDYETGGIKWDKITSIKQHAPQHVYDLAIENTHNFIANDIIAHNTYINNTLNVINGKVGIGTTTPQQELNVIGDLNVTGTIYGNTSSMNVNNSDFLGGYDAGFFMPLNTSVSGNFDFNGGWQEGGFSIIGGDIFAQTGYFYNISSLTVSHLSINGSMIPYFDDTFDLGNVSKRWRDIMFSRDAIALASDASDDSSSDSADMIFRGKYDSNVSAGNVTQSTRDITLRNIMNWDNATGEYRLAFLNDSGEEFVTFEGDTGRVGIGTTTPQQELNVIGDANITGLCVAENSLISMADGSKKKITEVKEGEHVLSLNEETGEIVSNKVKALLDMGEKPIYELTTESGRAINTTGNHPYLVKLYSEEKCTEYEGDVWNKEYNEFNGEYCERWVSVDELEEGDSVAVPRKDKNYDLSSSLKSSVLSILTEDCFLKPGSFDQTTQSNFSASANIGISLLCINCLAWDSNISNDCLGTISINLDNSDKALLNCDELSLEYFNTSDSLFFNSSITYSGVNNLILNNSELTIINLTGFSLKKDNNMLVSTTNCIFYQPSFLYLFQTRSFTSLPNLKQSSSVNSEFSSNLSNFLSNKALLTFSNKNLRIDSEMFSSGSSSICCFNSLGMDKVIFGILNDSVYSVEDVQLFKVFDSSEWLKVIQLEDIIIIFINAENNLLVSTTTNICYLPNDCMNLCDNDLSTLSDSSLTSFSVNLDLETINLNSDNSCISCFNNLLTSTEKSTPNSCTFCFNSSGILTTISVITEDSNQEYLNVSSKWLKVSELNVGDEIAVPDYETGGIKWDKIVSIKQHAPQHVYDLAIENTHNFIANDIIAHNTYINNTLNVINGKVGIGTTTPQQELNVIGDANITGTLYYGTLNGEANLNVNSSAFWDDLDNPDDITGSEYWYNQTYTGITGKWNVSGSNLFPYDLSKNVGIGTTTPQQELNVIGDLNVTGTLYYGTLNGEANLNVNSSAFWDDLDNPDDITGSEYWYNQTYTGITGKWNVSGSNLFPYDLSKNVGIGTGSPGCKLDVTGKIQTSGATGGVKFQPRDGSGNAFDMYNPTGDDLRIYLANDLVTIKSDGKVGIGTGSPEEKLHISGTGTQRLEIESTDNSASVLKLTTTNGSYAWVTKGTANIFALHDYTSAQDRITIDKNGSVGIGTTSPGEKLEVERDVDGIIGITIDNPNVGANARTRLSFNNASTVNAVIDYYNDMDMLDIRTVTAGAGINFRVPSAANAMFIESTGNVGIGTTSPDATLEVIGNAIIGNEGTGLVISSDGYLSDEDDAVHINDILDMDNHGIIDIDWSASDDGSGSGLDADKLDNIDSLSFLRSDIADNIGADLTLSGGAHIYRNVNNVVSVATPIESWSGGLSHTGAIYFVLPAGFVSSMMTLEFDGYQYSGDGVWKVLIGGYAYATSGAWINYNCQKFGSYRPQVRLGSRISDNKPVIIFGDDATVWNYPEITLTSAMFGQGKTDYLGDWESGTTTTVTTLFDGLVTPIDKSYVADSDKLDNIDSLSFLRSDAADVYNDAGGNIDLRFEGDTDPNLLFLDASADSIGIGTSSPEMKLNIVDGHTYGMSNVTYAGADASTDWSNLASIKLESDNNAMVFFVDGELNARKAFIQVGHESGVFSNYLGSLSLNPFGGNVGIGTASPGTNLVVDDSDGTASIQIDKGSSGNTTTDYSSDNTVVWQTGMFGTGNDFRIRDDHYANDYVFTILRTSGNVGIGTTTPSAKLDVEVSSGGAATIGSSGNTATGDYAVAMGYNTNASGTYSIAMGSDATASNFASVAMGRLTTSLGSDSIAIGYNTISSGDTSTAMGYKTTASGDYSTAMGRDTIASGNYSVAMGYKSNASGNYATAMGRSTTASGWSSTAIGQDTTASGFYSTAMSGSTTASGNYATAMGLATTASGHYSTAMGSQIDVSGDYSFGIGLNNPASDHLVTANNVMAIMGGNVGIGTATPLYALDVTGKIRSTKGRVPAGTLTGTLTENTIFDAIKGSIPTNGDKIIINGGYEEGTTLHVVGYAERASSTRIYFYTHMGAYTYIDDGDTVTHDCALAW